MTSPSTPAELAETLQGFASRNRPVIIAGASTKRLMAGPVDEAECVCTTGLRRVLQYEPRDLTISVEAGFRWRELTWLLAQNRQMVPLDPPFTDDATVGGVIASNSSGPRRRLFGTARDLVIGMQFATLEGKIIQSGGMVVKNVAGLDMGKLMIGSFGTLAAIAVVNFKLQPLPPTERSFLLPFPSVAAAIQARNQILASPLQPSAIDLLNPAAGSTLGNTSWLLAIRAGGNPVVVDRYERELSRYEGAVAFEQERHDALWKHIENLTPRFLSRTPEGAVVRVSCTLKEVEVVMGSFEGPALARAGSGVCYGYFEQAEAAGAWVAQAAARNWKAVIEFAPEQRRRMLELWPSPGGDLEIMRRVKALFDPANLLNRGRLYRLI